VTQIIPQIPSVLNNLLIIRLRNLGDCVLMTPVLEILKNWHPSLEITVLVEKSFVSVFSGNPHIARLIVLNRSRNPISTYWSRWEVMKALRGESYDLVWNLHGGSTSLMLALSPQSRMILGFEHYRNSNRYTHRVPAASSIFNKPVVHTVETQLAPLLWLGIPVTHEMMKLQVQVSRNASILVDAFLDRHKLTN
jgi:heptosyltransferase-3